MEELAEKLMEGLENEVSFVIPIFGGIPVPNSVVITWIIMAVLVILSIIFVRNLKVKPGKVQVFLEFVIGGLYNFFEGIIGHEGKRYFPYLGTITLYIACANLVGLFGAKPPTKDLNVTAALAIMSIILIQYAGIKEKRFKGWVKGFAQPMAILAPINVLEIIIRPLSLCMRLFGNILGGFVVMELIKILVPAVVPVVFSFYFDIFDGLIQTYVFVFLTSLFIREAME